MKDNTRFTTRLFVAALFGCILTLGWGSGALATVHNLTGSLSGLQEVPPNASPATGTATVTLDDVTNAITYNVVFTIGLLESPEVAAHIHCCSAPGVNSPVIVPLPLGNPKVGGAVITAAQTASMIAGLTYVNIHTMNRPGGEIRGQLTIVPPSATEPSTWGSIKSLYQD